MTSFLQWNVGLILLFFIECILSSYIPCASDQDCVINCDSYSNGCAQSIINATKASSLRITCSSSHPDDILNGGCQLSQIHCPVTPDSQCTVHCSDYHGCYSASIYSPPSTNLNVQCNDQKGSCLKTTIYADYSKLVYVSCYGSGELGSVLFASCQHLNIYGNNIIDAIHILCYDDYSCYELSLHSKNANKVSVFARGNYALSSSNIHIENASSIDIFCGSEQNEYGCYLLDIYAPSSTASTSPRTNILCQGMGCKQELYLYSNNGAEDFNISLNGCNECNDINSCIDNWYIHCGGNTFDIFHGDSCESSNCGCNDAVNVLNEQNANDYDECHIFEVDYECTAGEDCVVDCNGDFFDGCYDKIINAKHALSLSIVCNTTSGFEYGGCEASHIYCPVGYGAECNVECMNEDSCYDLEISIIHPVNMKNSLNLTCYSGGSCSGMKLYAEGMNNTDITTNCIDSDACSDLNLIVNGVGNVTIFCEGDSEGDAYSSCDGFNVYAMNVINEVKLICNGDYSCYNIDVFANNSNKMSINSLGDYAAYEGNIYGDSTNRMSIECNSKFGEYGCFDMNFYIPSNTSISCEGHGCNHLSLYAINGFDDIKSLSVNGCKECWKHNCIKTWDIKCNVDYSTHCIFFGYNFSCSSTKCGCNDNFILSMNDAWSNDEVQTCDWFEIDVQCQSGQKCHQFCNNRNACKDQTFYGGNATSLTVECTGGNSCMNGIIYCPIGRSSICDIQCTGNGGCQHLDVYGDEYTKLNIHCKGNKACQGTHIYVYDSLHTTIQCEPGYRSCNGLHVYGQYAKNITINCIGDDINDQKHHGLCYMMRVWSQYAQFVNISCIGNYSCWKSKIFADHANNVIVIGEMSDALLETEIHVNQSDKFELNCLDFGCNSGDFYITSNPLKSQINCYGFGCNEMNFYITNGMNGISGDNLKFNGCGVCETVTQCVNNWMIFCDDAGNDIIVNTPEYDLFDTLYNASICSHPTYCHCNENILNGMFFNNLRDKKCKIQTFSPTPSPTPKPTLIIISPQPTDNMINNNNTMLPTKVTESDKNNSNDIGGNNNTYKYILIIIVTVIITFIVIGIIYYFIKRRKSKKVIHRVIKEIVDDEEVDKETEMELQETLNETKPTKPYIKL